MTEERSVGALVMAALAIGLLAFAYTSVWFEYEFTSGRQTPPGGPQPEEETGIVRNELAFTATGWHGDIEPSDEAMASNAVTVMTYGIFIAGGALLIACLAEIPGIASLIRRRASLALIAIAFVAVVAVAVAAWVWLPGSMAGYGVDSPYTAFLDEPHGYTHTTLSWGWYAMGLAGCVVFAAGLFKFQAGELEPDIAQHVGA